MCSYSHRHSITLRTIFPSAPVWLPFLDQTTYEMGGIGTSPGNYKVGSFVELRTAKEKGVPVEIVGPGDKRLLTLAESTKAATFPIPVTGIFRHSSS